MCVHPCVGIYLFRTCFYFIIFLSLSNFLPCSHSHAGEGHLKARGGRGREAPPQDACYLIHKLFFEFSPLGSSFSPIAAPSHTPSLSRTNLTHTLHLSARASQRAVHPARLLFPFGCLPFHFPPRRFPPRPPSSLPPSLAFLHSAGRPHDPPSAFPCTVGGWWAAGVGVLGEGAVELAGVLECEPQPGHSLSLFGQFSSRIRDASLGVARSRARDRVLESEGPDSPVGTTMHLLCCHALSIFSSPSPILFRISGCHACCVRRSSTSREEHHSEPQLRQCQTVPARPLHSGTYVCMLVCVPVWKVTCECVRSRGRVCAYEAAYMSSCRGSRRLSFSGRELIR